MNAFFEALCRASVFGLTALAVALVAQWALGKCVPAAWRAWIWRIALVQSAFALLPIAPIRWEVLAPPTVAPTTATAPDTRKPSEFFGDENPLPLVIPDAPPIESAPPIVIETSQSAPLDWRAIVLAIYALGITFQFTQLARGHRQLQRTLRACVPNKNPNLITRLNQLAARLNLKSAPQILISEGKSPFLTGVFRPQIILPRALYEAENAQLDAVLAHELAHVKRRDLLWLGATWLLQTLLWFHPLSWAARRFRGLETECACDELALQLAPIAPQSYGALLLNPMNNSKFSSPLAAGTCDTLFALKTRLLRLNHAPKTPHKMAKLAFVAALLLSCGALVPLKLVARAGDAPAETKQVAGSAVVQGVVRSKQTKRPLAGITIMLMSSDSFQRPLVLTPQVMGTLQQTVTDTRGYFRFNTTGGSQGLGFNASIVADSKQNLSYRAETIRVFDVKNGQKRDLRIELKNSPEKAHRRGDAATAPVATPKAESVSGRIVDENGRALVGVNVQILQNINGVAQDVGTTKSDGNGRYRLNGLRAGADILVGAELSGYGLATSNITKNGLNTNYEMTMPRASASLRGVVIGEDGRPVRNFVVQPFGSVPNAKTDEQGRFMLKQFVPGEAQVRVFTPNGSNGWGPVNVRGGDQNVKIRLTRSISDARFPRPVPVPTTGKNSSDKTRLIWENGARNPSVSLGQ